MCWGLAKNERLKAEIAEEMGEAEAQYKQSGRAARLFPEFLAPQVLLVKAEPAWRTSCPRLSVREDANDRRFCGDELRQ
jgi:hypothetical protein